MSNNIQITADDQLASSSSTTTPPRPAVNVSPNQNLTPSPCHLQLPSPFVPRRCRSNSSSDRAMRNPVEEGIVKSFNRNRGHGFITPASGGEDIFVHISDVIGEYVPLPGDEVSYRLCSIPPKYEKVQAVHVNIIHLTAEKHSRWEEVPCKPNCRSRLHD